MFNICNLCTAENKERETERGEKDGRTATAEINFYAFYRLRNKDMI